MKKEEEKKKKGKILGKIFKGCLLLLLRTHKKWPCSAGAPVLVCRPKKQKEMRTFPELDNNHQSYNIFHFFFLQVKKL